MKRFAAAILIFILLFNLVGFRFVADYMQKKSDVHLEASLDNNQYDESQLIELKIPLHVPYQTMRSSYERYDGEVKVDGISYKYVKRKLCDDTLYLKCIPNVKKMLLQTAEDNFFKNTNDLTQNTNQKKAGNSKSVIVKKVLNEYNEPLLFNSTIALVPPQSFGLKTVDKITSAKHISPEQPPDFFTA